ncbi:MAG: hypothetical protein IJR90_06595 [Clostridia bacterium]|nr:hypothetical protein [Clostridia bacterium]
MKRAIKKEIKKLAKKEAKKIAKKEAEKFGFRFCADCGEVLSDDEDVYCKRCEYERKRKTRRRVVVALCLTAGVAAAAYVSCRNRKELLKKADNAREKVVETVRKIPIDRGITLIKRAGNAAGDKVKEIRIMIDDKVADLRK